MLKKTSWFIGLPSTFEADPINKLSLEISVTLESKMEESTKLVLPVDVNTLLSAIVCTILLAEKQKILKT
jgi:hypothetical protein